MDLYVLEWHTCHDAPFFPLLWVFSPFFIAVKPIFHAWDRWFSIMNSRCGKSPKTSCPTTEYLFIETILVQIFFQKSKFFIFFSRIFSDSFVSVALPAKSVLASEFARRPVALPSAAEFDQHTGQSSGSRPDRRGNFHTESLTRRQIHKNRFKISKRTFFPVIFPDCMRILEPGSHGEMDHKWVRVRPHLQLILCTISSHTRIFFFIFWTFSSLLMNLFCCFPSTGWITVWKTLWLQLDSRCATHRFTSRPPWNSGLRRCTPAGSWRCSVTKSSPFSTICRLFSNPSRDWTNASSSWGTATRTPCKTRKSSDENLLRRGLPVQAVPGRLFVEYLALFDVSFSAKLRVGIHKDRRLFLRIALKELNLLFADQPGLLGPKASSSHSFNYFCRKFINKYQIISNITYQKV